VTSPPRLDLRHPGLRLLVTGSTVSLLGDGIYSVAMAVAALRTADAASTLAVVAVAGLLPRIVFALLGGVLADRISRRLLLLGCDLVRAVVVTVLGTLLLAGTPPLWALVACVVPLGAATGAAAPAFGAILPDVVDESDLVPANALLSSVSPFAQLVAGPALGGVLAAFDVGLAMLADGATFVVSAVCVLLLRPTRQHDREPRPVPWAHLREGVAYVRRTPWLLVNLLAGVVVGFAVSGSFTLLPFLVTRGYDAPTSAFGYLLAVGGAAATLTAVVVGSLRPRRRPLASSYVMYVVGLAAVAGLGVAPGVWLAAPFVALLFVGSTAGNIWQDSVLGSAVPRDLRGRVGSLDWLSATVSAPLSITLSAALAGAVGVRATFVVAGTAAVLASAVGLVLVLRSGEPAGAVSADEVSLAA
jgi:predicted MFS family arabinose efflux permease